MESKEQTDDFKNVHGVTESLSVQDSEMSDPREKALVHKIDLFLLPTIWLMYLLSYVDRTKSVYIGYAIL